MPRRYRMHQRQRAVEETRQRIVAATMALHGDQGILGTSWEDIARRAGVSLATVYRHFPTLDQLVPACGQLTDATIRPPTPEWGATLFAGTSAVADRIRRLVDELCAFYERGAAILSRVRYETIGVPALQPWLDSLDATRVALVRQALEPAKPSKRTIQLVAALTDSRIWQALRDRNIPGEDIPEIMHGLVEGWIGGGTSRGTRTRGTPAGLARDLGD